MSLKPTHDPENIGEIIQIIGAVVDIKFPKRLPDILNALYLLREEEEGTASLTFEVAQHLGENVVRAILCGLYFRL